MSIQRSKSAPQSIAGTSTVHVARSYSHENVYHQPIRIAQSPVTGSSAPLASPTSRAHRGDPFSLGNFFPTSRVFEEEEDWNWLRAEDVIHDESEPTATVVRAPATMMFEDKATTEAIKSEDKLGVLSLNSLFSMRNNEPLPADDRLFSPYSDDEAVDIESLHLSLCARRARGVTTDSRPTDFAELFFAASEEQEEKNAGRWRTFLKGILGFLE